MVEIKFYGVVVLLLVVGYFVTRKATKNLELKVVENESKVFRSLDIIADGKQWMGEDLDLIHSMSLDAPSNPNIREQLCKSASGRFILLVVILNPRQNKSKIIRHRLFSEGEAKHWLESCKDKYIEIFGMPEKV